MDPRMNPYAPGAGTIPPELAGRDELILKADIQMDRCQNGLSHRGLFLVGLRGVGKTVLLNHLAQEAEAKGFAVVSVETPENRSLPALIVPALRSALLKLNRKSKTNDLGQRALRILGGFVKAMKLKYKDVELGVELGSEPGVADSGDLEHDLTDLLIELGYVAQKKKTAFALFVDEIQYIKEDQFACLIVALHRATQKQLPVFLMGAGLPQLLAQAGRAKSYAERLFEYAEIGPLNEKATYRALQTPALRFDVKYQKKALAEIFKQTQGYPYFLQEWGKHCWQCASRSPISYDDALFANQLALQELDMGFFRVRFDRLTPSEKKYLRAMAELGEGSHRSGDIANILKKDVQTVAPIRSRLIEKGMIYSPAHGENKFTVPLFVDYMKRTLPKFSLKENSK